MKRYLIDEGYEPPTRDDFMSEAAKDIEWRCTMLVQWARECRKQADETEERCGIKRGHDTYSQYMRGWAIGNMQAVRMFLPLIQKDRLRARIIARQESQAPPPSLEVEVPDDVDPVEFVNSLRSGFSMKHQDGSMSFGGGRKVVGATLVSDVVDKLEELK